MKNFILISTILFFAQQKINAQTCQITFEKKVKEMEIVVTVSQSAIPDTAYPIYLRSDVKVLYKGGSSWDPGIVLVQLGKIDTSITISLEDAKNSIDSDVFVKAKVVTRNNRILDQDSTIFIFDVISSSNVSYVIDKDKALAYPNPASNFITISGLPQDDQIEVYDISGKKILITRSSQEGESKVNISSLSSGIYFVKTKSGFSKKILKE